MSQRLIDQFNKLYPGHPITACTDGCSLHEKGNDDKLNTFKHLNITGFNGWEIPPSIAKDSSSFHTKTQEKAQRYQCHELMTLDCDGLLCQTSDKYLDLYIFELKSSYHKDSIVKAKDQVMGSMLKLRWLMSLLQRFEQVELRVKGIIAAYQATDEQLNGIRDLTDKGAVFARQLHDNGSYHIESGRAMKYWHPLNCTDIDIQLIKVPRHAPSHTINFATIAQCPPPVQ